MEQLAHQAAAFGLTLTTTQQEQFALYLELLMTWNQQINLTAVRQPDLIQERHFLDSLTCATVTGPLQQQSLIDVGTGAGFPGLPLKILYPQLRLTLVDSVGKKTRFLEVVVAALGLTDVQIITERSEIIGQQASHREQYDWAVARGVAELKILAEYLLPLCRVGGKMVAQKGENAPDEAAAAAAALQILGAAPSPHLHPIQLPHHQHTHYLVLIHKQTPTPAPYPRRVGVPAKRPLS